MADMDVDSSSPHQSQQNGNGHDQATEFSVELPPTATPGAPAGPTSGPGAGPAPPSTAAGAPAHAEVFVAMPVLQQHGDVFVGPGSKREAQLLGLGLTKLSSRRKDDLTLAKRYAMDLSIKQIMLRQQKAHHENQQKQAMYAQALSLMARVYIGSISFEVREEMIKKAFEVYGPIKSINMSWDPTTGHHKGFAFLEFDVPEAALLAQESMNGQLMGGRNLKVGRPSNMPQAQPIIEMVQQDAKKYHRVYVSSVHPDLSESDLKSVFEAFGEVVKCQLARQSATGKGSHRGFGYIEFNNAAAMNEAIAGMNMFDLGGQFLRVGRCITPPEALTYLQPQTQAALPTAAAQAAAAVTAKVMAAEASGQAKTSQGSGSNSPRPMSPATIVQPSMATLSVASPGVTTAPPTVVNPTLVPPSLAVPPPPVAIAKPQLYAPPVPSSAPSAQYGYGVPPPPMNGYPVAPPPPSAPPVSVPPVPPPTLHRGFGGFAHPAAPVPPTSVPPPTSIPSGAPPLPHMMPPPPPPAAPPSAAPKGERSFEEKMERILERTKAKQDAKLSLPVTFGAIDPLFAPKDPLAQNEESGDMLAITGKSNQDVQSMALALIGDNAVALKGGKVPGQADAAEPQKKKKRVVEAKKIQPKLNTAQALAAAAKAGELSDAVINEQMNSEDATLASQEGLAIRGNDARHLLMAKLMRTNRSCILVLRNMVSPEEIDEYLEEEIKEECSKYGTVQEVVIANDQNAGIVKIFVRFADPKQVDAARAALDKRFFGGHTVSAEIYDQALFDHNDLSG
ncbi:Poly(U)-binding-splicing factor half pint [Trichostrongylus colubriformis]|uniref:Poly(U)-binding-splicing factor half pint n=1 Tax=Trichostrongylus colubriformis TaxID=6319 RepID=A0AAN8G0W6_TRICO